MATGFPRFDFFRQVFSGRMAGLVMAALMLTGCAAPGPKYLDLSYPSAMTVPERNRSMGLSRFADKRVETARGYLGFRDLPGGRKEIFAVTDQNLAATLTRVSRSYLEQNGFSVSLIPGRPVTLQGLSQAPDHLTHTLAADINRFECTAEKKGIITDMALVIDLTFYLGTPDKKQLSTIPIVLTLTRTEWHFSRKKLETFINESLAEILAKALPFN
jgi:hypothetical protein